MNFLKRITKNEIFEKVAEIANIQIKQKFRSKTQDVLSLPEKLIESKQKSISQTVNEEYQQPLCYDDAQQFILSLGSNSKQIRKQQREKRTQKQVFSELQIQPIYLQQCQITQLFKMQLEFGESGGYERTEILHNYLKQVNDTLKKILFTENLQILDTFELVNNYLTKISIVLAKIKLIRQSIQKITIAKAKRIKQTLNKKLVIKQKLDLLAKMKQKQEISLLKPENIEQVYYTQRSRHKLYLKIKSMKTQNAYFQMLKSQITTISRNNILIILNDLHKWINQGQVIREKNIQKLFICLYFIKNQPIYKDNGIQINLKKLEKQKFINQIETVKGWKNYQYIRDPAMKGKILEFLNILIQQIQTLS